MKRTLISLDTLALPAVVLALGLLGAPRAFAATNHPPSHTHTPATHTQPSPHTHTPHSSGGHGHTPHAPASHTHQTHPSHPSHTHTHANPPLRALHH